MKIINSLSELNLFQEEFPIFYSDKWMQIENSINSKCIIVSDSSLKALIPIKLSKLKFLKKGEYLYTPLDFNGEILQIENEKKFLNKINKYFKEKKICDVIFPPQHFCVFKTFPSKCDYFKIGILDVNIDIIESNLIAKYGGENRRQIRKAKENNIEVKFGHEFLNEFYISYEETSIKKNIPLESKKYFENLITILGDSCLIGICLKDGIVEAGFFDVFDKKNAYSFFSGTKMKLQEKGSKKYLINEGFNYLRSKEIDTYHFGGYRLGLSKKDKLYQVQEFKRSMGADIIEGYHFISIINRVKYNMFLIALKFKSIIVRKNLSIINFNGVEIKKSK